MRDLLHILLSLGMWGLFGYYWHLVLSREIGSRTVHGIFILILIVVSGLLLTLLWVVHNLRLARRNRRRGQPPAAAESHEQDTIGRPVVGADLSTLRAARRIDISLTDTGEKRYSTAEESN